MSRDLPDFTRKMQLDLLANAEIISELAKLIGAIPRISTSGRIIMVEDFSDGQGRWAQPSEFGSGTVEETSAVFHTKGYSLIIAAPDTTPCGEGIIKCFPYREDLDKIGLEFCFWAVWTGYIYIDLKLFNTDYSIYFSLRFASDGTIEVLNDTGNYESIGSIESTPIPLFKWWEAKLIVDLLAKAYISLQIGDQVLGLTDISGYETAASTIKELWVMLSVQSEDTPEVATVIDYVILTDET